MKAVRSVSFIDASAILDLADRLEDEAAELRTQLGEGPWNHILRRTASRIREAVVAAEVSDWVRLEQAALMIRVKPDTLRARCKRQLSAKGLAQKKGGLWYLHVNTLREYL